MAPDDNDQPPLPGLAPPRRGGNTRSAASKAARKGRAEALILSKLSGLTWAQVAKKHGYKQVRSARRVVHDYWEAHPPPDVLEMRLIENGRLERATRAIWPAVLKGNLGAVDAFVKLSARRSALNGMDLQAPAVILPPANEPADDPIRDAFRERFNALPVEAKQEFFKLLVRFGLGSMELQPGPGDSPD